jgi:hypothetical protein
MILVVEATSNLYKKPDFFDDKVKVTCVTLCLYLGP